MAKFRIRLKVQALEVEIDGEREDIPAISSAVQHQFAGLLQPSVEVADGNQALIPPTIDAETAKPKAKGRKRPSAKGAEGVAVAPLEFRHDAAKYGNPLQGWSIADKGIWLLFVLNDSGVAKDVTGPQLAATFNLHFKAAGALHPPHVTRELGKAKVKIPALVGEDKKQDPSFWYVTTEGEKYAQQIIQAALKPA
ncbi:MAG: hypothetical protein WBE76_12330 [Terracidiphilus sp.]